MGRPHQSVPKLVGGAVRLRRGLRVDGQGEARVGVAEPRLRCLQVHTGADELGGVGPSEIVKAQAPWADGLTVPHPQSQAFRGIPWPRLCGNGEDGPAVCLVVRFDRQKQAAIAVAMVIFAAAFSACRTGAVPLAGPRASRPSPRYVCSRSSASLVGPGNPVTTRRPERFIVRLAKVQATLTEVPSRGNTTGPAPAVPVLDVTYHGARVFRGDVYDATTYLVTGGEDRGTGLTRLGTVPLCLAMFSGNQVPTVLVAQAAGGSLGLGAIEAFHPSAKGRPWRATSAEVIGTWRLTTLQHQVVIQTGALVYFFGPEPLAGSAVRLFQFNGQRFVDRTDRFPGVVGADAQWQWATFHAHYRLGPLAAWVADECTLGRMPFAILEIRQLQREGRLRQTAMLFPGMPSGKAFARYATRVCVGAEQRAPFVPPS